VNKSINQADESDVEVEEIEMIEEMNNDIDRQMKGLGSKSVFSNLSIFKH